MTHPLHNIPPSASGHLKRRLFLVEDDLDIGKATCRALRDQGMQVSWVRSIAHAQRWLQEEECDLILLDLNLPDGDGLAFLDAFRRAGGARPVLVLSGRDGMESRVHGLDLGADDYLIKPFALDELMARCRALLRRSQGRTTPRLDVRGVSLNLVSGTVRTSEGSVVLSRTEFQLLAMLLRCAGSVVPRCRLEDEALQGVDSNSLDMHMSNLRRKLGGELVRTVRGVGYIIDSEEEANGEASRAAGTRPASRDAAAVPSPAMAKPLDP